MNFKDEKLIKRFLFAEMSETERFEFEERFITDADLFEEIKVVEDELIEKYVRGWMDTAEGSKFEQHFLTTNKRLERVEFTRRMIGKIEKHEEIVEVPLKKNEEESLENDSVRDRFAALFLTPKVAMAGVLTLLVAVLGTWVLYQNFGGGNAEIVDNDNGQTVTPMPDYTQKLPTDDNKNKQNNEAEETIKTPENDEVNLEPKNTNTKVENTPKQTLTPEKPKEEIKKTPVPAKTPPIQRTPPSPILALFSGTTRSGGKNSVLTLPKGAKAATLQLNLESVDYKEFQAQLTDANGNVIFQRGKLKASKTRVNLSVPAKSLKRGDYIIKLFGKNDAGENESVADFQFRVQQ